MDDPTLKKNDDAEKPSNDGGSKEIVSVDTSTPVAKPQFGNDGTSVSSEPKREYHRRSYEQTNRFRISIKPSLVMLAVLITLATSAAIHFPWMYTATSNVKELVAQLNQEIISDISSEVKVIFDNAERVQDTIAESMENGAVDVNFKGRLLNYFFPLLKNNPDVTWISYGVPNGDFYGVNRVNSQNFQSVRSYWNEEDSIADRHYNKYVLQEGRLFQTQSSTEQRKYDARERPWYQKAIELPIESLDSVWTDVYIFSTSRLPGINIARRVDKEGESIGVVSIAIELERLSNFMRHKFKTKPGTAAILRGDGSMVAFVDANEVTYLDEITNKPKLRPISESYHPLLSLAAKAIAQNSVALDQLDDYLHFDLEDKNQDKYYVTLAPVGHQDWSIVTIVPENAFLSSIKENNKKLLVTICLSIFAVGVFAVLVARHLITKPISKIIKQAESIEKFELNKVRKVNSPISELDDLSNAFNKMSRGLGAFRKYLPSELVQILVQNDQLARVGGINRTMTIYFSDLENFTTISEILGPALVPHLSEYLDQMSGEIHAENGIIDKYIGDAIMAFWGAPNVNDDQAVDACRAALRCQQLLSAMAEVSKDPSHPVFKARIGLNTGRVIVGNIGSNSRMDYTVLGDPVNLAARLESLNKTYGTRILIGSTTYEFAKYEVVARKIDTVNVKGKDQKTPIYELLAMRTHSGAIMPEYDWVNTYEEALDHYERQEFEKSIKLFENVISERGGEDAPSSYMIERCKARIAAITSL
ncbi:adenylate/guanylate cyclase domain-containing protein [Curvivirga aplysinae]|uniref:adenylate/guanylate cyclase domain-containing protein n=1 Tax=Curvivirga aplysinae TaxID=2529852 RepID=UPI0012BD6A95|nr:adenylate/guanylate cyclase domain-containing protein [Curvivirga aplysinae]MTI11016.1 adenylate/guanylate cyclase domain-containing protein [Curvivirga aplysinae]